MKILITGCNGQLGSELRHLEAQHSAHTFYNTDVAELDITNQLAVEDFVNRNGIDGIVNCAAYTAVDKAESERELCTTLNTVAPSYLAAAIGKRGGWMIHISTDYVFNGEHHQPYQEDDTLARQRVWQHQTGRQSLGVTRSSAQRSMIIRTAWLYSSYGQNFVKTMMRLGREKEQLGVVFDQIGTPTCAADLAEAILSIIEQGVRPGLYHFSNEGVTSWYDFAIATHRLAGIGTCQVRPLHTSEYPTAASRPAYSVLDKTKIKHDYHLTIPHWETSLARTIQQIMADEQS